MSNHWAAALAGAAVLGASFLAIALRFTPVHYEGVDVAVLALLYGLLAIALQFFGQGLARLHPLLGAAAALGVASLLVFHLREYVWVPGSRTAFAVCSALVGLAYWPLVQRSARSWRAMHALTAGVAALLLVGLTAVFYEASDTLRWVLLRHNKILGTPAYYLLSRPVAEVREELWESRAGPLVGPNASTPAPGRAPRSAPHIAIFLVDTLRADALATWGGPAEAMPALNRWVERSHAFVDVWANAAWTRPSVASLFTGKVPEAHGAVDRPYRLPEGELTLAEALAAAGYRTAAIVSNYGAVGRDAGFAQGFETFIELDGAGAPYARAERMNARLRAWLQDWESQGKEGPVFLYLHYLDPHDPYLSGGPARTLLHREARSAYRNELEYTDSQLAPMIEELVDRLDGRELVTLLVSDHGEEFGEHAERGHGRALYREVVHVPAVLNVGGEASRIARPLELRDFFDLVLALVREPELDVAAWAQGQSRRRRYTSLYSTTPHAVHRPYLSNVAMRGVQEGDRMAIWSAYGETAELYDLRRDPDQLHNIAGRDAADAARLLASMEEVVLDWARREPVDETEKTRSLLRALGYVED